MRTCVRDIIGLASIRFQRSIQVRNVFLAETAAFEMGSLLLEDALQLVVLYAEAEDDKLRQGCGEVAWPAVAGEADDACGGRAFGGARESVARPCGGWSAGALETLAQP